MSTIEWTVDAAFDGIPLSITSLATTLQRRVTVYTPVRGEQSETFDQGSQPVRFSVGATLVGVPEQIAASIVALEDLAENGDVRTFAHPIRGNIECRLDSVSSNQETGRVTVSLALTEVRRARETGDNLAEPDTSRHDVEVAAIAADDALETAGESGGVSVTDAVSPVLEWDDMTAQTVQAIQIESVRAQLESIDRALISRTDREGYRALIGLTRVRGLVEQYARTLQGRASAFVSVHILADIPLASLLLQLGIDPDQWLESVISINSLRRVSRLVPGTALLLPRAN